MCVSIIVLLGYIYFILKLNEGFDVKLLLYFRFWDVTVYWELVSCIISSVLSPPVFVPFEVFPRFVLNFEYIMQRLTRYTFIESPEMY